MLPSYTLRRPLMWLQVPQVRLALTVVDATRSVTDVYHHLARYHEEQSRAQDRLRKLLGRKVGKARLGEGLVRDIETLVKEVDIVVNVL